MAKKLGGASPWKREYFYLGVEFTLAALSSALLYVFDIAKDIAQGKPSGLVSWDQQLTLTASFTAITLCLLLVVLSIHQDWESKNRKRREQIIWLCVISNLIGAGLIAGFVLLIKGIQ
jgi:hypothetical protein